MRELIGQGDIFPFRQESENEDRSEKRVEFLAENLEEVELLAISKELQHLRNRLKATVYSARLLEITQFLEKTSHRGK